MYARFAILVQRVRIVVAELRLAHPHHQHKKLFRLIPSTLIPVCRCETVHAGQRVYMVRSKPL